MQIPVLIAMPTFRLPVLANTVRASVIAWLECSGYVLLGEGPNLYRESLLTSESVKLEIRPRSEKRTNDPGFFSIRDYSR